MAKVFLELIRENCFTKGIRDYCITTILEAPFLAAPFNFENTQI
jgi:hypothetical protein